MKKDDKTRTSSKTEAWCECDCPQCDIGAHERCNSDKCHMPKWKDVNKPKKPKKST